MVELSGSKNLAFNGFEGRPSGNADWPEKRLEESEERSWQRGAPPTRGLALPNKQ